MEWNDELVLAFARVSQKGSYGDYKDAPKIEDKLKVFKRINGLGVQPAGDKCNPVKFEGIGGITCV